MYLLLHVPTVWPHLWHTRDQLPRCSQDWRSDMHSSSSCLVEAFDPTYCSITGITSFEWLPCLVLLLTRSTHYLMHVFASVTISTCGCR